MDPVFASGQSSHPGIFSSANLATDGLHASATSSIQPSQDDYDIGAHAYFQDILHVTGQIVGTVTALLHVHLDGILIASPQEVSDTAPGAGVRQTTADAYFYLGAVSGKIAYDNVYGDRLRIQSISFLLNTALHGTETCNSIAIPNGYGQDVTNCYIGAGNYDLDYDLPMLLTDTDRDITLESSLYVAALAGGQSLFGDTAQLTLDLPAGLSFTSDSGVFLSAIPSTQTDVPEPASFGLLLGGLICLASLRRGVICARGGPA